MAEENNQENQKKGGLVKIIIMAVSGIVLLGIGLGIGIFMGGDETDPSSEISQIIDKKENPDEAQLENKDEEVAVENFPFQKMGVPD